MTGPMLPETEASCIAERNNISAKTKAAAIGAQMANRLLNVGMMSPTALSSSRILKTSQSSWGIAPSDGMVCFAE